MKNRITELLKIKYPIIQGGMAWNSDAKLAAAVSNAGGAGIIGMGSRDAFWAKEQIKLAKELTNKPFGVNLALLAPNVKDIIKVICEEKVDFVTLGGGNPMPWIETFCTAGIKVIPVVPNVRLAKRVETAGVDAIVIEGMEAGGHIGTLTTMALLSNVIPNVSLPVIAAGGIADGRGIAAALVMGADAAQIGSRFMLSEESPTHPLFKQAIIDATDTDSVVTGYSRGTSVRCLKNPFTEKFLALEVAGVPTAQLNDLATGTNRLSSIDGDLVNGSMQVGQSLNLLNKIQSCEEIVNELMAETKQVLANVSKIAL